MQHNPYQYKYQILTRTQQTIDQIHQTTNRSLHTFCKERLASEKRSLHSNCPKTSTHNSRNFKQRRGV